MVRILPKRAAGANRGVQQRMGRMAEPITIATAVITGLVGAYKAYTEYKAAVAKAEEKQEPKPEKSEAATKGEQAAPNCALWKA